MEKRLPVIGKAWLKDKNEISIKDENDNNVNENTVTNKTIFL